MKGLRQMYLPALVSLSSYQSYQIQGDRRLQSESNRRFRGPRIFKTLVREVIALRPWRI